MQSQNKDDHSGETGTETENSSAEESQTQNNGSSKKRKRPQKISCELCKARKVKCDRQEPSCGWCARNNRICIYKERKKPGLRASYGVELEDKINRMEAMLNMLGRRVEDHISSTTCYPRPPSPNQTDNRHVPSGQPTYDTISRDTPVSHSSWGPNPPTSYPQVSYTQGSGTVSVQGPVASDNQYIASDVRLARSPQPFLSSPLDDDLPPSESLEPLIDLYFKHVNPWTPILSRKATFDVLLRTYGISEADKILLHAIVVVTLRFSKDSRLTAENRKKYYISSKQKVQLYALEHPSIRAMQALTLVAIDAWGTSSGIYGWNLLALLAHNIIQLGLGVESSVYLRPAPDQALIGHRQNFTLPQPDNWIEDEGRRRLFWMTYIIDRYATITSQLDFTLDEMVTDRPLPCRYDLFSRDQPVETRWFRKPGSTDIVLDNPDNLGSFSYHCEILRILSQIHRFLRNPIDIESTAEVSAWQDTYRELDRELGTWLSQLPSEYRKISQLCHSDPGSRVSNWIMIHAAFVTSAVRLHSVAAFPTSQSAIFLPSFYALRQCLTSVESLCKIVQDVLEGGMLDLLGPPFSFSLWTCGRVLLVHAATMNSAVDPNIDFLINTLESMGQHWEIARNRANTLRRLVSEGQQAEQEAQQNQPPSSCKTYSSMRRTAFHLSSLASRKPRSVLDPASTRHTSQNELDYFDAFEWFNYPRLPDERSHQQMPHSPIEQGSYAGGRQIGSFSAPNPDSDWLNFEPPHE